MHSPHPPMDPPLPAPITMSLTTTPTSRFGFSMVRGKFCHSCFEITARTALAQFGHSTLKTRVRFKKGGRPPRGCATDCGVSSRNMRQNPLKRKPLPPQIEPAKKGLLCCAVPLANNLSEAKFLFIATFNKEANVLLFLFLLHYFSKAVYGAK